MYFRLAVLSLALFACIETRATTVPEDDGFWVINGTCAVSESNLFVPFTNDNDKDKEIVQLFGQAEYARYINVSAEALVAVGTPLLTGAYLGIEVYLCADQTSTCAVSKGVKPIGLANLDPKTVDDYNFWISYDVERDVARNHERAACARSGIGDANIMTPLCDGPLVVSADTATEPHPTWVAVDLGAMYYVRGVSFFTQSVGANYYAVSRAGVKVSADNATWTIPMPVGKTLCDASQACSSSYFLANCTYFSEQCSAAYCNGNGWCLDQAGATCMCKAGYSSADDCKVVDPLLTLADYYPCPNTTNAFGAACTENAAACRTSRCSGEGACTGRVIGCDCDPDHGNTLPVLTTGAADVEQRFFFRSPEIGVTHIQFRETAAWSNADVSFGLWTCPTGNCQEQLVELGMKNGLVRSRNIRADNNLEGTYANPAACARVGGDQSTLDSCSSLDYQFPNTTSALHAIEIELSSSATLYGVSFAYTALPERAALEVWVSNNGDSYRRASTTLTCSECGIGYFGATCTTTQATCDATNCNGNGWCARNLTIDASKDDVGFCVCPQGFLASESCAFKCPAEQAWTGTACTTDYVAASAAMCSGNGVVDNRTIGICTCDAGFFGSDCSQTQTECNLALCGNKGVCIGGASPTCSCNPGSGGLHTTKLGTADGPLTVTTAYVRLAETLHTDVIRIRAESFTVAAGGRFQLFACPADDGSECTDAELFSAAGSLNIDILPEGAFFSGPGNDKTVFPAKCGRMWDDHDSLDAECTGHGWLTTAGTASMFWEIQLPAKHYIAGIGVKDPQHTGYTGRINTFTVGYLAATGFKALEENCACDTGMFADPVSGTCSLTVHECTTTRCHNHGVCTGMTEGCACDPGYSALDTTYLCGVCDAGNSACGGQCANATDFFNGTSCSWTAAECRTGRCNSNGACKNDGKTCTCDTGYYSNSTHECLMDQSTCDINRCASAGSCLDHGCNCTGTFGHLFDGFSTMPTLLNEKITRFVSNGVAAKWWRIVPETCVSPFGGGVATGRFEFFKCATGDCVNMVALGLESLALPNTALSSVAARVDGGGQPWCGRVGIVPGEIANGYNCTLGGWRSLGCDPAQDYFEAEFSTPQLVRAISVQPLGSHDPLKMGALKTFDVQYSTDHVTWVSANLQPSCLTCQSGMFGTACDLPQALCNTQRCLNHGTCSGQHSGCVCANGYSGANCETCNKMLTENYRCSSCPNGTFGTDCSMDQATCDLQVCGGKGICNEYDECECTGLFSNVAVLNANNFHATELYFEKCVTAKYIRITPKTWQTQQGGFFEFYTCAANDPLCLKKTALGMANLKILNHHINAETNIGNHFPWCGRLGHDTPYTIRGCSEVGWLGTNTPYGQWFTVELVEQVPVCALTSKGLSSGLFIKTAIVETSLDGNDWRNIHPMDNCDFCSPGTYGKGAGNRQDCEETDRDECGKTHCSAHGACGHKPGTCVCYAGWRGAVCSTTQAACDADRCNGAGVCTGDTIGCDCTKDGHSSVSGCTAFNVGCGGSYDCAFCKDGWHGVDCDMTSAYCRANVCNGMGSCEGKSGMCRCDDECKNHETGCLAYHTPCVLQNGDSTTVKSLTIAVIATAVAFLGVAASLAKEKGWFDNFDSLH